MFNTAKKEGITLIINSGYRSYDYQKEVYDQYKTWYDEEYADNYAARPDFSEHQTGLAIDLALNEGKIDFICPSFPYHGICQEFRNVAPKFGFIERYQEGKENITGFKEEAWHYRYVGVEAATYIHDNNITFDEYYAYFIEK